MTKDVQSEVLNRIVRWATKEEPVETFPSRSVERRVTAQREARKAWGKGPTPGMLAAVRAHMRGAVEAARGARGEALGVWITDRVARGIVAARTHGVQDALADWLPPDHPDRKPRRAGKVVRPTAI